jgi:hypothetical protein
VLGDQIREERLGLGPTAAISSERTLNTWRTKIAIVLLLLLLLLLFFILLQNLLQFDKVKRA